MNTIEILAQLAARFRLVTVRPFEGKYVVEYRRLDGGLQMHYAPTLEECLVMAGRHEGVFA